MVEEEEVSENVAEQQKVEEIVKAEEVQGIETGKVANKAKNCEKGAKDLIVEHLEIFLLKFQSLSQ